MGMLQWLLIGAALVVFWVGTVVGEIRTVARLDREEADKWLRN